MNREHLYQILDVAFVAYHDDLVKIRGQADWWDGKWVGTSHTTFCRKLRRKLRAAHKR